MGTKSGLRSIATKLASVTTVALVLALTACAPTTKYEETAAFLQSKFSAAGVEGFTAGTPDYGFTLEAITQLAGSGQLDPVKDVATSVLTDASVTGDSTSKSGFLFDASTGAFKSGLAGKFLFASKVSGIDNEALRQDINGLLVEQISADGAIAGSGDNTFDYGWVVLGLVAQGQGSVAAAVATKLTSFIREDGGFGFDTSANTTASSADAVGMVLMAIAATKDAGSAESQTKRTATKDALIKWLETATVSGNHFEAWGDVDVNSTAYAAMGLQASGVDSSAYSAWLTTQLVDDGGLETPWSEGKGDTFATIQGLLALDGRSYPSLIGK
jgi:hypothetical protein